MAATIALRGITTLIWGTAGILPEAGYSSAKIKSADFEPIHSRTKIPGNYGATAVTVDIHDGRKGRIVLVYDTGVTWPAKSSLISVKEKSSADSAVVFEVINEPKISAGNTKEKEITLELEMHNGITLSGSATELTQS